MSQLFLYQLLRRIDLTLETPGVSNWNLPMNETDFIISKGVTSNTEFWVRNVDRKAITLTGKVVVASLLDPISNRVMLTRALTIVDPVRGIVSLTLNPGDSEYWRIGRYSYTIFIQNADSSTNILFLDQSDRSVGVFEVVEGPFPGPIKSYTVTSDLWVPTMEGSPLVQVFYSPSLPGNAYVNDKSPVHTIAIYTTNFLGTFWVEGTLDSTATDVDENWFNIPIGTNSDGSSYFMGVTGITPFTFELQCQWVRIRYLPDVDNMGTVDKVLFRN